MPSLRLTAPANVLVMPAFHSASIAARCCRNWAARPLSAPARQASTSRCRSCGMPGQRHRQHGGDRGLLSRQLIFPPDSRDCGRYTSGEMPGVKKLFSHKFIGEKCSIISDFAKIHPVNAEALHCKFHSQSRIGMPGFRSGTPGRTYLPPPHPFRVPHANLNTLSSSFGTRCLSPWWSTLRSTMSPARWARCRQQRQLADG